MSKTSRMTRSEVMGLLWTSIVSVTFTKKDGTQRTIVGTHDPSRIPFHKQPATLDDTVCIEGNACPIYEIKTGEWRSFCWNSILRVQSESHGYIWYDAAQHGVLHHEHQTTTA